MSEPDLVLTSLMFSYKIRIFWGENIYDFPDALIRAILGDKGKKKGKEYIFDKHLSIKWDPGSPLRGISLRSRRKNCHIA